MFSTVAFSPSVYGGIVNVCAAVNFAREEAKKESNWVVSVSVTSHTNAIGRGCSAVE